MQANTLYEQDEHAWIEQQIALIRAGKPDQLDGTNLVLFLNDMMIRDRRELRSRITNLLVYLLKLQYLSERATDRTIRGVTEQQQEINTLLGSVPRLQEHVPGLVDAAYRDAVRQVRSEHGSRRLPQRAPWTLQQAVEFDPPPSGERLPALAIDESKGEPKSKSKVPDEAVTKVIAGGKVVEVAREYGIPRQTLADHVKRAADESPNAAAVKVIAGGKSPTAEPYPNTMDDPDREERGGCD